MKKQTVLVWVAILALFGVLAAACGGDDDDAADGGSEGAADTADGGADEGSDSGSDDAGDTGADSGGEDTTSDDAGDDESAMTPQRGGSVTYGITSDGTGFNTLDGVGEGAIRIIGAAIDTLTVVDVDGNWNVGLAKSLTPNDDATVWTMTLRPDVTFHDGVAVDADAVKANFDQFKAAPNVGFALSSFEEVVVIDPLTIEIRMNRPWAAFPYSLTGAAGWMQSPDSLGEADTIVGTGPFILQEWTPGDGATLTRNPNYWAAGEADLPYLDEVTFKVIPDQSARRLALEAGDIDAYCCPADSDIVELKGGDKLDVYINEGASNEGLFIINTTKAPTDDVRVRRAMALATNQELMIETFRSGLTTPAKSFIEPSSPFWVDTDYPTFDMAAAKALVEEYEEEVGPIEFDVKVSNFDSAVEQAELLVSLWQEAGMDVTVDEIQPGTEVPPVIADDFSVINWAQFSAYDPDGSYVFFHSSGGFLNWSNLVSEKIDEGLDIGRESFDFDERAAGYAMVQEAMAEEIPFIWIDHFSGVEGVIADPKVHGIVDRETIDGVPLQDFLGGSYFAWAPVWIEQE